VSNVNGYFATTDVTTPHVIAATGTFALIKAGAFHTCAVNTSNRLWCWGNDNHGSLGAGYVGQPTGPVEVALNGVTDFATGMYHTCALASGSIYCFGWNDLGALGNGSTDDAYHSAPVLVTGVTNAVALEADAGTTCALLIDHTLSCWGSSQSWGTIPNAVTAVTDAVESFGVSSSALLVFTQSKKLIHVTISDGVQHAEELTDLNGSKLRRAYFADKRYFAVDNVNALWGWERKGVSNGDGNPATYYTTKPPSKILNSRVSEFAAGPVHQCALQGADLLCWGVNSSGQVFSPPTTTPVPVPTIVTY
jgi:alpha-tubulin suppressor-like RCC1 family protein